MTLLLDTGALLALERGDPQMWDRLAATLLEEVPVTHGGVIAQAWRGGHGRQAPLARALRGVRVVALDDHLGRASGLLLARSGTSDAVDAALVALARPGDRIVTSDPDDIDLLVQATGVDIEVIPI